MSIYNLTQHVATKEQHVVEPSTPEEWKEQRELLTFDKPPTRMEIEARAEALASIVEKRGSGAAMIGGAPFLMSTLERVLIEHGINPCYAFTKRQVEMKDGKKISVFKMEGFVWV